jgi:membrane associated rhomboid family serine protease
MPRENLRSIYVFLFLTVAFYMLQLQDPQRYVSFFAFDSGRILSGEVWRLVTFQFIGGGTLWLFFQLLILYLMGGVVEEELGTARFLMLFGISTLGSAAVGFITGAPFIGSFFASYTLLFVFATITPETVFYIFFVLPVKVKWLAWIDLGILAFAVFGNPASGMAAAAGAAAGYGYFLLLRRGIPRRFRTRNPVLRQVSVEERDVPLAAANRTRLDLVREALASPSPETMSRVEDSLRNDIVAGVNICPPVDFKPEHDDGYCIRCEGFAECSLRYLKLRAGAPG